MDDAERITGKKRWQVFEQLIKSRFLLHMRLKGTDFEKLTVVTGIKTEKNRPVFMVDSPQDLPRAVTGITSPEFLFNFTGESGIPYTFKAAGGRFLDNSTLLLDFPEVIRRKQRRSYFRIKPPVGVGLTAVVDEDVHPMNIVDISEGGALVMFAGRKGHVPVLTEGHKLRQLGINLLPGETEKPPVTVKEALVRRVVTNTASGKYHYGIMFTNIARVEQQALREYIYATQRQILKKKLREN
ncbi:MAG: PilZ domain-containing protein [Thermodesulfobacteriota bacterium]|nr:PilZ domain-containing protein [Thermodesulfobacteriota bacterium]